MNIKRIYACWVYVRNLDKSVKFYETIGFDIKFVEKDWVEFNLGETSFALQKRPKEQGRVIPQKTRIMFETDDIELLYKDLMNKKVKLIGNIRNESYGKLLTFEDPDGHWLEFFENTKNTEKLKDTT